MNKIRGIILLDGADCTGKTTLAGEIAKRASELGANPIICHLGKPELGKCWEEHKAALCDYIIKAFAKNMLVIADRHFLSEAIYGAVYSTGSEYPYAARHVDRLLHRFGALRVICAPPVDFVIENHAKMKQVRREEYDSGMDKIAQRYLDLWNGAVVAGGRSAWHYNGGTDYIQQLTVMGGVADRLGWYHYDLTTDGSRMGEYVDMLLEELDISLEMIDEPLLDVLAHKFTGFPSSQSVLLVGDKIKSDNPTHTPFLSNSNSSEYLAKTLHSLGVDEKRVVIINANDAPTSSLLHGLASRCARVIAMGREAERSLLLRGIKFHAQVRHPQHARRFSMNDSSYRNEMQRAFDGLAGALK